MKRLFLTSSVGETIQSIAERVSERSLLFITTASESKSGDRAWLREHREKIVALGFDVRDFTITGKTRDEITVAFSSVDVLCMEGGDTGYLLKKIQETDATEIVRAAIAHGVVYIGSSAGSMVTTPSIELTSEKEYLDSMGITDYTGMGFVDFHVFVHIQREKYAPRVRAWAAHIENMHGEKVIPLQDNQYVEVIDDLYRIVTV